MVDELTARRVARFAGLTPRRRGVIAGSVLAVAAVVATLAVVVSTGGSHKNANTVASRGGGAAVLPGTSEAGNASRAAQMWAAFPVDASPRPIVLLGEDTLGPDKGFTSGDAKLAFLSGQLRWDVAVPSGPATQDGFPLMSATDAVQRLRPPDVKAPETSLVLGIKAAALSTAEFATDRGVRTLPAWRFQMTDAGSDIYVLAVALSARAEVPGSALNYGSLRAAASADGRSITIRFVARHDSTDPCDPPYTSSLDVVQTNTAVALSVTIHPLPIPSSGPDIACAGVGTVDTAPVTAGSPNTRTVQLDQPLGARVVVDGNGSPYSVTT